jgi:calcium-dependent protein kinase
VFKCQDRTRKLPRAIKIIKKRNLKTTSTLFSELNILRTLDHPNIIKLYDVHDNKDFFYVVTEHCAGGELF